MQLKSTTFFSVLSILALAGCMNSVSLTHGKPLPDGKGFIGYNCGTLEGAAAQNALAKSHGLMVNNYYPRLVAFDAKASALQKSGNYTPDDVQRINAEGLALRDEAHKRTAAAGCEYMGIQVGKVVNGAHNKTVVRQ